MQESREELKAGQRSAKLPYAPLGHFLELIISTLRPTAERDKSQMATKDRNTGSFETKSIKDPSIELKQEKYHYKDIEGGAEEADPSTKLCRAAPSAPSPTPTGKHRSFPRSGCQGQGCREKRNFWKVGHEGGRASVKQTFPCNT